MRGVIYARYSSDNQREESIEGQIRENTAFAEKNGIVFVGHYIERAVSTKINNRLFFNKRVRISRHLLHHKSKRDTTTVSLSLLLMPCGHHQTPHRKTNEAVRSIAARGIISTLRSSTLIIETDICSHGKIPSLTECSIPPSADSIRHFVSIPYRNKLRITYSPVARLSTHASKRLTSREKYSIIISPINKDLTRNHKMIAKYITNTYKVTDPYKEILLYATDAKVKIEPADDNDTRVVFFEKKNRLYEFFVEDGILTIQSTKAKWYNFLKIGVDRSEIKLYIPKSMLEKISVMSNVGCVDLSSINCSGMIDIKINTGKINLEHISCMNFKSKGNTGSVSLNDCIVSESIAIKSNTGKVSLNDCSALDVFVQTNTGSVRGRLPSNTAFTVSTKTGKIEIPKFSIGEVVCGRCEIKTKTGSIKFD